MLEWIDRDKAGRESDAQLFAMFTPAAWHEIAIAHLGVSVAKDGRGDADIRFQVSYVSVATGEPVEAALVDGELRKLRNLTQGICEITGVLFRRHQPRYGKHNLLECARRAVRFRDRLFSRMLRHERAKNQA